jgi:hypothetical protein
VIGASASAHADREGIKEASSAEPSGLGKGSKSYRASGLGPRSTRASRGLHPGTLYGWASKLGRSEPRRREPRFLPVQVGGDEAARGSAKRPAEVEVTLRNGWRVRVAGEVPAEGLVELLVLLEGDDRC